MCVKVQSQEDLILNYLFVESQALLPTHTQGTKFIDKVPTLTLAI